MRGAVLLKPSVAVDHHRYDLWLLPPVLVVSFVDRSTFVRYLLRTGFAVIGLLMIDLLVTGFLMTGFLVTGFLVTGTFSPAPLSLFVPPYHSADYPASGPP
jgi:hypothetical protein